MKGLLIATFELGVGDVLDSIDITDITDITHVASPRLLHRAGVVCGHLAGASR
jgi:hypothetical protein